VAAAILSLAVAMKAALPPPEAPLEHAEALIYVKIKPLNGSYWLGVYAPYGDVAVRQIRVGNATYVLDTTAPVGRDTWLNASGRPITAQCGDSVEVVTAKGGAARSLAFIVQCPRRVQSRTEVGLYVDVERMYRVAWGLLKWFGTIQAPKIAAAVDPDTGEVVLKNIYSEPVVVVADLQPGVYPGDEPLFRRWWGGIAGEFLGTYFLYLRPGEEWRWKPQDIIKISYGFWFKMNNTSPLYIAILNKTDDFVEGHINGIPFKVYSGQCQAYQDSIYKTTTVTCSSSSLDTYSGSPFLGKIVAFVKNGSEWYLAVRNGSKPIRSNVYPFVFYRLDNKYIAVNWTTNDVFSGTSQLVVGYNIVYNLYVYPADVMTLMKIMEYGSPVYGLSYPLRRGEPYDVDVAAVSFVLGQYVEAFALPNGSYVVQWVSQTNSVDVRAVLLRAGDRLFIPFNLTVSTPFYIDFGDFQIAVPRVITHYWRDEVYMTVGVPRGVDVDFDCYEPQWGWGSCPAGTGFWVSNQYSGEYYVGARVARINAAKVGNKIAIYVGGDRWESTSPFGMWYPKLVDPVHTVELATEEVWPRPDWVWGFKLGVYLDGERVGELVYDLGPGGIRLVRWTVKEGKYGVYVENRNGTLWMTASPGSDYAALVYTSEDAIPYVATRPISNDLPTALVAPMYKPISRELVGINIPRSVVNWASVVINYTISAYKIVPQAPLRTAILAALKTTENLAQRYRLVVNYTAYCDKGFRGAYASARLYLSSAQGEPLVSAGVLTQGPIADSSCNPPTTPTRGGGGGGGGLNECPVYISSNARPIGFLAPQWHGNSFTSGLKAEIITTKVDCHGNKQSDKRQDTVKTWVNINGVMGIADASGNHCGASNAQPSQDSDVASCPK